MNLRPTVGRETLDQSDTPILGKPKNGVFPRSLALWLAAIYVGLFIIRPWELLFPELRAIKFERTYAIFMLLCIAGTVGFRLNCNLQNGAVAVWCGVLGISTALAWNEQIAWNTYYVFLTLVVCYGVLLSVIRSPYELLFIIGAYIGFMEIYLGKALWEYFIHGRHSSAQGLSRLIGIETTFATPNALAGSIVISLPLWLFLWQSQRQLFVHWPLRWQRWVRRGLILYPLLSVVSVFFTNSRQGMVNLFLFVFLSIFRVGRKGRFFQKAVLAMLFAGIVWQLLPAAQKSRVQSIWDPSSGNKSAEESKQSRIVALKASMEVFGQFPITGVGLDNFRVYRLIHIDGSKLESHNMVAQILSETGLLGASAFALFLAAVLINCRRTVAVVKRHPIPDLHLLSELAKACRLSLLFLFVEGISQNNFDRYNWLWLAAFSSLAAQFAREISGTAAKADNFATGHAVRSRNQWHRGQSRQLYGRPVHSEHAVPPTSAASIDGTERRL